MSIKTKLRKSVEYLSIEIGPRAPGSQSEKTAAGWIAQKFTEIGYEPIVEEFECPVHAAEKAVLEGINNCEIDIQPTQHSPIGRVAGELVWLGFGDSIPSEKSLPDKIGLLAIQGDLHEYHRMLDRLEASQLAGLIVIGSFANQTNGKTVRSGRLIRMPVATVSVNDARELRKHVGLPVTLDIIGDNANPSGSQNVIARLDGKSDKTVVVIAHYDSAANCPGALDNASGIAVLLEIAEQLAGTELQNNIEFVASGAEEFGGEDFCGFGGKAYFRSRMQILENIVACFEIDHVGDNLGVRRLRPWGGKKFLADIPQPDDFIGDKHRPVGGDGGAAYKFGLPIVSMSDKFIPASYYHTPADTIDLIDFDALVRATEVGLQIIQSLSNADGYFRFIRQGDVLVRPAMETDVDKICEITRQAFAPVSTDKMREDFFKQKLGHKDWWEYKLGNVRDFTLKYMDWVLVAEVDDKVVGYASYILDNIRKLAEVGNNAVDPAYQGRGIGKLMQQEVFARFDEEGYTFRTVSTLVDDLPARKIYERMGFEELTRSIVYLRK